MLIMKHTRIAKAFDENSRRRDRTLYKGSKGYDQDRPSLLRALIQDKRGTYKAVQRFEHGLFPDNERAFLNYLDSALPSVFLGG